MDYIILLLCLALLISVGVIIYLLYPNKKRREAKLAKAKARREKKEREEKLRKQMNSIKYDIETSPNNN